MVNLDIFYRLALLEKPSREIGGNEVLGRPRLVKAYDEI